MASVAGLAVPGCELDQQLPFATFHVPNAIGPRIGH